MNVVKATCTTSINANRDVWDLPRDATPAEVSGPPLPFARNDSGNRQNLPPAIHHPEQVGNSQCSTGRPITENSDDLMSIEVYQRLLIDLQIIPENSDVITQSGGGTT